MAAVFQNIGLRDLRSRDGQRRLLAKLTCKQFIDVIAAAYQTYFNLGDMKTCSELYKSVPLDVQVRSMPFLMCLVCTLKLLRLV